MNIDQINKDFGSNMKQIDWDVISTICCFSEDLLDKYKDYVNWNAISLFQKLSETQIEKYADKVNWSYISANQKLSEDFIRKHCDSVDWDHICIYQRLSEDMLNEFANRLNWRHACLYQQLSEEFITKHINEIDWVSVSMNQKLSPQFIAKWKDHLIMNYVNDNWQYQSTEFKKKQVEKTGLYECHDDYFIAYKGVRGNGYSKFNFKYQYEVGHVFTDFCDYSMNENGFGLSVWTKGQAKEYGNPYYLKVKVRYEDVGRVIRSGAKIRCTRIEILEMLKD